MKNVHPNSREAYRAETYKLSRRAQLVLGVFRSAWQRDPDNASLTARDVLMRARKLDAALPYDLNSVRPRITELQQATQEQIAAGLTFVEGIERAGNAYDKYSGKRVSRWRYYLRRESRATDGLELFDYVDRKVS